MENMMAVIEKDFSNLDAMDLCLEYRGVRYDVEFSIQVEKIIDEPATYHEPALWECMYDFTIENLDAFNEYNEEVKVTNFTYDLIKAEIYALDDYIQDAIAEKY